MCERIALMLSLMCSLVACAPVETPAAPALVAIEDRDGWDYEKHNYRAVPAGMAAFWMHL